MTRARKFRMAALAAVVVLVGLSFASAAGLSLSGGVLTSANLTHPCAGTASAVPTDGLYPNYDQVTVTLPSTLCSGMTVQITVLNGGPVIVQGSAVASGGTAVVMVPSSFTTSSFYTAVATVGGWHLPVTWSQPTAGPIAVGNATTTLVLGEWQTVAGSGTCIQVTVSSNTTTDPWLINLNMNAAPFTPSMTWANITANPAWPKPLNTTPVNGIIQLSGGNGSNNITGGTVTLCVK